MLYNYCGGFISHVLVQYGMIHAYLIALSLHVIEGFIVCLHCYTRVCTCDTVLMDSDSVCRSVLGLAH